jgi:heat shock protein HslJ
MLSAAASVSAQPARGNSAPLAGTSWQLVAFRGGDGTTLTPDDGSKYTIAFDADGNVAARIDCNRAHGTWTSTGPARLELSQLAVTQAQCLSPPLLHGQIVRHLGSIRSYAIRNGHLFLALMADAGVYEFQPMAGASASPVSPVSPRGPFAFACTAAGAAAGSLRVTFYATQPALALLELDGTVRPAFQVRAASGSRYEGDGVLYWEAHGEAMVSWMGHPLTCRRTEG